MFLLGCCQNPANVDPTGDIEVPNPDNLEEKKEQMGTFSPASATKLAESPKQSPGKVEPSPASPASLVSGVQRQFVMELHSALLDRSFAKVGWMDPYAVVTVGGKEIERSKPASFAHKKPVWGLQHTFEAGLIPDAITIQVWDKNNFHRDVFCGAVTVPCSDDMGIVSKKDFSLTKKDRPTGTVKLSLSVAEVGRPRMRTEESVSNVKLARATSLGGELDHLMEVVHKESGGDVAAVQFQEVAHPADDEDPHEKTPPPLVRVQSNPLATHPGAALVGSWKCVDTFGLEDFLKATGVGMFQRKIAMAASWPSWDFMSEGSEKIKFVNHSAIGDLTEEITLGSPYSFKDGHKNLYSCTAEWTKTSDGGTLMIQRNGTVGNYSEERKVTGDKLEFVLIHSSGVKWGRSFVRLTQ